MSLYYYGALDVAIRLVQKHMLIIRLPINNAYSLM